MRTVGALNQLIAEKVAAKASSQNKVVQPEPAMIWERLVPIVIEELGVRREQGHSSLHAPEAAQRLACEA